MVLPPTIHTPTNPPTSQPLLLFKHDALLHFATKIQGEQADRQTDRQADRQANFLCRAHFQSKQVSHRPTMG